MKHCNICNHYARQNSEGGHCLASRQTKDDGNFTYHDNGSNCPRFTLAPLRYFRVSYSYDGGAAHTITSGHSIDAARYRFQKDNPHVKVTDIEAGDLCTP